MPDPNDLVKIKARTPRFRTRPLMQSTRREEPRPTPLSYPPLSDPPSDEDIPRTLLYPFSVAAPDDSWLTQRGTPAAGGGLGSTRHSFPYAISSPATFRNYSQHWDYAVNAHSIEPQFVAASAGRGATDPKRAGSDLAARIWSVKKWAITGSFFGQEIDDTVAAGSSLEIDIDNSGDDREETPNGNAVGRQFAPTSLYLRVSLRSDDPEDESSTDAVLSLIWPEARRSTATGDGLWIGESVIGAAKDVAGPLLMPIITGIISWSNRDNEGDAIAGGQIFIQLARQKLSGPDNPYWDLIDLPVKLCGYTVRGHQTPDLIGDIDIDITITASEFWGADEWVA